MRKTWKAVTVLLLPSPADIGFICSTSNWTMKGNVPKFLVGGRTGLSVQEGGDTQHSLLCGSSRNGGKRWASEELCFLLTSRWQHGPAVRDQVHYWTPLKLSDSRVVSRAFSALAVINGAAHLLHPKGNWACIILEAAERFPEPLSDRKGCNILDIISLHRHSWGPFCCAQNAIFGKNKFLMKKETITTNPKI